MRTAIGVGLIVLGLATMFVAYWLSAWRSRKGRPSAHWTGAGSVAGMALYALAMAVWERWVLTVAALIGVAFLFVVWRWMVGNSRWREGQIEAARREQEANQAILDSLRPNSPHDGGPP